jgi:transposase InsO family protein
MKNPSLSAEQAHPQYTAAGRRKKAKDECSAMFLRRGRPRRRHVPLFRAKTGRSRRFFSPACPRSPSCGRQKIPLTQSFSCKGHLYDNAVAESFFKFLKLEETDRRSYASTEELEPALFAYAKFYHNARPQSANDARASNEVICEPGL